MTVAKAMEIKDGQTVDMTGETWTVRGRIGSTKVILQRADAPARVMSVDELAGLLGDGGVGGAEPVRPVVRDLADVSEREWEVARARHQIVVGLQGLAGRTRADVEAAGRLAKVDASTVYDWIAAYERRGYVTDLIPTKPGPKKGSTRLEPAIEGIIEEKIDEIFLNKTPVQITRVQRGIEEACRKAGLKPPAGNTVRARIGRRDVIAGRLSFSRTLRLRQILSRGERPSPDDIRGTDAPAPRRLGRDREVARDAVARPASAATGRAGPVAAVRTVADDGSRKKPRRRIAGPGESTAGTIRVTFDLLPDGRLGCVVETPPGMPQSVVSGRVKDMRDAMMAGIETLCPDDR